MNAITTITPEQANELYDLRRNKAWSWYELANRYGITEDWHDSVELPEGTDTDVATIVNACTHTVRKTGSCTGADTITEWFQWVCTGDDLVHDLIHLLVRATRMTSEWRSAVSPLDAERDRVGAWYEAMRLCGYKDADVTDSSLFCRALHIVESDPNWFFHCVVF